MAITQDLGTPPVTPDRSDKATFSSRMQAFFAWFATFCSNIGTWVTQANALEANVNNKESLATIAAGAAIEVVNATLWVSETPYTIGQVVWDPTYTLRYTRRTTGAGTTEPHLDPTNWRLLSRDASSALSANDIDLATANSFSKTITTNTTFTVSNVPVAGQVASFFLVLTNAGSATITWWSGVKWVGGTAPELTVSGRDRLGFVSEDGGTTWDSVVLKDLK